MMETFEVYPNKGIGPFRLGMTEDKVVELQNRLFPGVFPGYYCRTNYLDGRLAGVGLLADENRQILWDGLELTHVHVEELIPRLARKAEFACDCVDPELACNYRFPTLGLELWREMAYHPKLLDNPEFQAHMRVLPENLEYEQTVPPNPGTTARYAGTAGGGGKKIRTGAAGEARRRRERMTDIKSMNLTEMAAYFKELGEPVFRAKQVFQWLHRGVFSFDEMTNLSKPLREKLAASCILYAPQVERRQVSSLDGTIKYLWRLRDGNCIETVLMRYHHGNTVCISSQVGCRMGCAFCASTLGGKVRDLTPAEMLDQVLFTQMDSGAPVSNIVLMGIGEPLDNFDTVLRFLELVNSPDGLNIGMRHISLSTCGLTEKIDKLADHQLQLTLSVSLHAPDDETRSRIMPVNRSVGVEKLFAACRRYFEKTGRRISYEYAMIDGVNDADWQADLLARHLKGTPGHVNLIPLNNVEESPLKPSRRVAAFQKRLESHGITATVRRKLGCDIDSSCGQLRRKTMQQEHT